MSEIGVVLSYVSEIGAEVKVVNSRLCGWVQSPTKAAVLSVSPNMDLSMCSDLHVKYWMPRGFHLTMSLLLDYHVTNLI